MKIGHFKNVQKFKTEVKSFSERGFMVTENKNTMSGYVITNREKPQHHYDKVW